MATNHTKLEAVNMVMEAAGFAPVSAVDTGGNSDAAEAERAIDRHDKIVQAQGWHENTEFDVEIAPADVTKVACVISGDGTWTAASKILGKTAAFASYTWASGDQIYVSGGTGVTAGWYEIQSKTDDDNIVLKDSLGDDDLTDVTTTLIGWDDAVTVQSDVIRVDSDADSYGTNVALRNGMLYDLDDNTYTFDATFHVTLIRQLPFTTLTIELQDYIIASAAVQFQRRRVKDIRRDALLRSELDQALVAARKAEAENSDANILDTSTGRRIHGLSGSWHTGR